MTTHNQSEMTDEQMRDQLFEGKTLRENLRDIVARNNTGYSYAELLAIVADEENEDGLDPDEIEQVDKTVNLLAHLFTYLIASQKAIWEREPLLMFAAAVKASGGRLEIPRAVLVAVDRNTEIRRYDERDSVVFELSTEEVKES